MNATIAAVGIDWGSTNVRAFAFDNEGRVLSVARSSAGAMSLSSHQQFERALNELAGDWLRSAPSAQLIACGMVGARGAWVEAGYCAIGANVDQLATHSVEMATQFSQPLCVIPGVASDEPDVMRGEETQLVGLDRDDALVVLPGTHSKWVELRSRRIASFKTFLTGEMNAVIREHTSIGKVLQDAPSLDDKVAVAQGIDRARRGVGDERHWLHELFGFRSRAVTQGPAPALSTEFSAWLIASEIMAARRSYPDVTQIQLLASQPLANWYEQIAVMLGFNVNTHNAEHCVASGLWRILKARTRLQRAFAP